MVIENVLLVWEYGGCGEHCGIRLGIRKYRLMWVGIGVDNEITELKTVMCKAASYPPLRSSSSNVSSHMRLRSNRAEW